MDAGILLVCSIQMEWGFKDDNWIKSIEKFIIAE